MKRLSVIIPMYNVAPCVERCIRSLEDQDIPKEDYELICINDGSPDNCREIIEQLQQEFSNIVLINQENQGVSRARNIGFAIANGEYILYIDPDDYVVPNVLKSVLAKADSTKAQVIFLGFRFLNEDGSPRIDILNTKDTATLYTGLEANALARGDGQTDPDRMWSVLFNRLFLSKYDLQFIPNVPYLEDGELIARILCLAELCIFSGKLFYMRTTRPGSATNSNLISSKRALNGFIKAAQNLTIFRESHPLNYKQRGYINTKIVKFTILPLTACIPGFKFKKLRYVIKTLKKNKMHELELKGVSQSYYSFGKTFNQSVYIFILLWILRSGKKSLYIKLNRRNEIPQ